jgi:imidazolonepropionase-like amidohydrolase
MLSVGRRALARAYAAGITLVRDAGDIHGINLELRRERRALPGPGCAVLCPGRAIRNAGRYGSFMAQELAPGADLEALVRAVAVDADQIKVLLTGIIDFKAGAVKGPPQFSLDEVRRIVCSARALGRRTFAHCSGALGIDIALAAGIDSIEHGFFVTRAQLHRMADNAVSWVPTFAPVHFQWAHPERAGWDAAAVAMLARILDDQREQLAYAYRIGVPVLVGSDAGSQGVRHGASYIDELMLMAGSGAPLEQVLHSATALPRALWGCAAADVVEGASADLVLFEQSPFDDLSALRRPLAVCQGTVTPSLRKGEPHERA